MKLKIIILSLILVLGLSLVCAFESQVYHIGVNVPSDDSENVTIITEPDNPSNLGGGGGGGGSNNNKGNSDFNTTSPEPITLNELETNKKDETLDLISGEPEPGTPLENFYNTVGLGGVVGVIGTTGTTGALVLILGALGGLIFVRVRKSKKK